MIATKRPPNQALQLLPAGSPSFGHDINDPNICTLLITVMIEYSISWLL